MFTAFFYRVFQRTKQNFLADILERTEIMEVRKDDGTSLSHEDIIITNHKIKPILWDFKPILMVKENENGDYIYYNKDNADQLAKSWQKNCDSFTSKKEKQ